MSALTVTDLLDELGAEHGLSRHPRPVIGCPWCIDRDRVDSIRRVLPRVREEAVQYALAADDLRRALRDVLPLGETPPAARRRRRPRAARRTPPARETPPARLA